MFTFDTYLSPFTWRYGSEGMRRIFSEKHKYELWRKIWVALARAQHKTGLVTKEELKDLETVQEDMDLDRILAIEKETKHDVVAAIKEFAEKAKIGGGKIHLGATSMDIVDNADAVRAKEALAITEEKIISLLGVFAEKIQTYAAVPCIGYTHLQPAEPTTVGYRLSVYAQDLLTDYRSVQFVKKQLKGKGMRGAVGTAASFSQLLQHNAAKVNALEKEVMADIGIDPVLIATQVYPRKYDFLLLSVLASLASSLAKFAGDVRILQSPSIGEWSEPFRKKQIGSSAMPFKKNPINSEKICSLSRYIASLPIVALENASHSYLERTLDDSANKRIIISEAFLATDEILSAADKLVDGLLVNEKKIAYNLEQYAPFAATEAILMEAVKQGADRQKTHEVLRNTAMKAWADVQEGKENPMKRLLLQNMIVQKYISRKQLISLLDVRQHVGNAPERALLLADKIQKMTQNKNEK